jgi:hypothetical protein
MAVIKEVASFDVDTTAAQQSINAYINSLQKLEQERSKNIKLGKSTVAVNKKIDQSIDAINKSLKQTSTTRKGQLAQLESTRNAQEKLAQSTKKRLALEKKVNTQTKKNVKSLSSQRKAFSNLKFLAVGAVSGAVAALGQLGESIDSVNNVLFPAIGLQNKVAEATKSAAFEYVQEKAALDNKFEAVDAATVGTREHTNAVNDIVSQYGPYLSDLAKEELALGNSTLASKEATKALLERSAAQIKASIAQKLIQEAIDGQIDATTKQAQKGQGVTDIIATGLTKVTNILPAFFIGRKLGLVPTLNDVADKVTDVGTELDNIKTESAIEQLKLLGKTGSGTFESFLKQFDGLADIFGDIEKGFGKTPITPPTKPIKDLSGTIAGLNKQLSEAKKFLKEGIQITNTEGLIKQKKLIGDIEKQIKDLQDFLKGLDAEPIPIGELEFFKPDLDTLFTLDPAKVEASLKKGLQALTISDLRLKLEQAELEGLIDIDAIEKERNLALKFFRGTAEERDALNATFNQKRLQREQQTAKAVLQLQLQILQIDREVAMSAGENLTAIDKAIAQLKLSLTELDAESVTVDVDIDTDTLEDKAAKTKETLATIVSGIEELGGQIIGFFAQQAAATLSQLESDISHQESILGELLSNQAGANAAQVQLERDRLDALVAQRKKATEQQAAIATTEIALNLAIGVARAAAEGGGIGSAFTIAALILAAGIGFIQARQQAAQAFAGGTDYVGRGKGEASGTDTVHAMLDEGEAVIQKDKNRQYSPAIKAIRRGAIPAKDLNEFVQNYRNQKKAGSSMLITPSMYRQMEAAGITLNGIGGNGISSKMMDSLLSEQKKTRKAIETLPIHQTKITERGLTKVVTTNQNHKARNNKRFR